MSGAEHAAEIGAMGRVTNDRQAAKVRDARSAATLVITHPSGNTVYVTGTDAGLYAVGIGRGGGLYLAQVVDAATVTGLAKHADSVDIVHERSALPTPVRDPQLGGGRDG